MPKQWFYQSYLSGIKTTGVLSLSPVRLAINRTLVELKLRCYYNLPCLLLSINRTLVELKHLGMQEVSRSELTINRTLVELKPYRRKKWLPAPSVLSIVP